MEDADKLANTSDQRPRWPKEEINTPQGPVLFGIYGTVGANNWSYLFLVVGFVLPNFMESFWLDSLRNPLEACHRPGNLLSLKMKIPESSSDGSVVRMVLSDTRTTSADLCFAFLDLSCLLGRIPRLLCPVSSVFWKRAHLSFLAKSSWCHGAFPYTAFVPSPFRTWVFRTYPTVSTRRTWSAWGLRISLQFGRLPILTLSWRLWSTDKGLVVSASCNWVYTTCISKQCGFKRFFEADHSCFWSNVTKRTPRHPQASWCSASGDTSPPPLKAFWEFTCSLASESPLGNTFAL